MENKNFWWYRLAIIIYIIIYIVLFLAVTLGIFYETKPYVIYNINKEKSYIQCKVDDSTFAFNLNPQLTIISYFEKPTLDSYSVDWATKVCLERTVTKSNIQEDLESYRLSKQTRNFTEYIEVTEETHGSWKENIVYTLVSMLGVYFLMYIIFSIFNWIAFGESFKKPKLLKMWQEED